MTAKYKVELNTFYYKKAGKNVSVLSETDCIICAVNEVCKTSRETHLQFFAAKTRQKAVW